MLSKQVLGGKKNAFWQQEPKAGGTVNRESKGLGAVVLHEPHAQNFLTNLSLLRVLVFSAGNFSQNSQPLLGCLR